LTLAEVPECTGIDAPALSRLETGKNLNQTLAALHTQTVVFVIWGRT
jgi:hypothetical protein